MKVNHADGRLPSKVEQLGKNPGCLLWTVPNLRHPIQHLEGKDVSGKEGGDRLSILPEAIFERSPVAILEDQEGILATQAAPNVPGPQSSWEASLHD